MREWKEINICRSASGPYFFKVDAINAMEAEGWHLRTTFVDPRFPSFGQIISGLFYRDVADAPKVPAPKVEAPKVAPPSVDDLGVDPSSVFPRKKTNMGL